MHHSLLVLSMNDDTNEYYEKIILRYNRLLRLYEKQREKELMGILVTEKEFKTLLIGLKEWIIAFRYRFDNGDGIYYKYFGNK